MEKIKRFIKTMMVLSVVGYIAFCLSVYFFPQWFFYHPTAQKSRLENAHANGYKAEYVVYHSEDGTPLHGWYVKPQEGFPVIMFLHGNSYNIEKFYTKMLPLSEAGYGVFMPEYRGFGGIKGDITETALAADSLAALIWLKQQGYNNDSIILYGMSLGSYTAINTAYVGGEEQAFRAVILEVPFDSLYNVVKDVVPVPLPLKWIIKDRYENQQKIAAVHSPILIMGGTDDRTVPLARAKNLFEYAQNPKKMIIYQGAGHSDLYNFRNYRDILTWLKENEETRH